MSDDTRTAETRSSRTPWNKGKLTGPKPPLKVREIWAIRIRLQLANRLRDLALFNLAIDSKLRGRDLGEALQKVLTPSGPDRRFRRPRRQGEKPATSRSSIPGRKVAVAHLSYAALLSV
jgi:hypothetical protein